MQKRIGSLLGLLAATLVAGCAVDSEATEDVESTTQEQTAALRIGDACRHRGRAPDHTATSNQTLAITTHKHVDVDSSPVTLRVSYSAGLDTQGSGFIILTDSATPITVSDTRYACQDFTLNTGCSLTRAKRCLPSVRGVQDLTFTVRGNTNLVVEPVAQ